MSGSREAFLINICFRGDLELLGVAQSSYQFVRSWLFFILSANWCCQLELWQALPDH